MKAIHNICFQPPKRLYVVINHKTTKFENNSQHLGKVFLYQRGCYQSQNYKIWKQFTTNILLLLLCIALLSITKLQNLKAIHNYQSFQYSATKVIINRKTTKFESNSQPIATRARLVVSCYQSQNYKIWKQFTTYAFSLQNGCTLLSITKLQNLKAIHNYRNERARPAIVVINHKTTKFESNS